MVDLITLSRLQFAVTTVYHFFFVPLTLGLSIYIAIFETLGYVKKDDTWRKMALFMGQLFLINFAMGVVTGIVQEFQFGMNWSGYSRFVGDIFGAPLAIEALVAFFLESTFLGVWVFGRKILSRRVQVISIWIVAIASNLSAYWILVANSFMQAPVGYVLRNGRAEMTDFVALITNPHVLLQFPHVVTAGLTTAAIFIMGISAYKILKKTDVEAFSRTFKFGAVAGLLSLLLVSIIGDAQGKFLIKHQPMKMAAAEALWESEEPAALSLFAVIDEKSKVNKINFAVPKMLSFMSFNNFTGKVYGINNLQKEMETKYGPGNYIPPVNISFWSFRIMVGLSTVMLFVLFLVLFTFQKNKFASTRWLLLLSLAMIPLPYICNTAGWILAEMGRQPWIVYGVLPLKDAVSKAVSSWQVLTTLIGFSLIYGILAVVDVYLLVKYSKKGLMEVEHD
jgi:cytochrome d ubiquinol oxidase subunit I